MIDGLDGDRVDDGRAPFVSSLINGQDASTTYYRESRSVMPAETNPNHAAMMTGAYPDDSGIAGNAYALYAPLQNEDGCGTTGPFDEAKRPSNTSGESANCLTAPTLFEMIKTQGNPEGLLSAAIFGKPKLGRIFAGKDPDGKRWVDHIWAPCASGADDDEYCAGVPTNPASGYGLDDAQVMDEVLRTIREGVAGTDGKKRRPDFTFVNLHQVDSAGHAFTTDSGPYDTAIGMADDEVRRLVAELRSRGEWSRTVLILLSDHSMDTTPPQDKTSVTSTFSDAGIPEDSYVLSGTGNLAPIFLSNRVDPGRFDLLARMARAARAQEGVDEALYREPNPVDGGETHRVAAVHPSWRMTGARSPDLVLTAKPGHGFRGRNNDDDVLPGSHGSPNTRDNFFAVVGGGPFVRQMSRDGIQRPRFDDTEDNPRQAENVDVAATVAGVFGRFAPGKNAGRFLDEAIDRRTLPGGGAPAHTPTLAIERRGKRRRASWGPPGGRYDIQVRTCRGWRKMRSRTPETGALLSRRTVGFRVRLRVASGRHSSWVFKRISRCR